MPTIFLLALLTFVVPLFFYPAHAQQAGKIYRIGFLDRGDARTSAVRFEPFWQELRRLGWIEGRNLTIESRFADNGPDERTVQQAEELVRLHVDLIVCASTGAALRAKKVTTTIPIVLASSLDPVGAGLVASLARPGGNVTGVSSLGGELNTKRLEVLKDAVPNLIRVGIPQVTTSAASVSESLQAKQLTVAARALNIDLVELPTKLEAKALEMAFQSARQKKVAAIMIYGRVFFAARKHFAELAAKYSLPAIYPQKEFVDEGGLMYYGIDEDDLLRRPAGYVDKILKGANPADLPVQLPTKFELVINLKAAKQIGLTIPPHVLARADRVIR